MPCALRPLSLACLWALASLALPAGTIPADHATELLDQGGHVWLNDIEGPKAVLVREDELVAVEKFAEAQGGGYLVGGALARGVGPAAPALPDDLAAADEAPDGAEADADGEDPSPDGVDPSPQGQVAGPPVGPAKSPAEPAPPLRIGRCRGPRAPSRRGRRRRWRNEGAAGRRWWSTRS